MTHLHRYNLVGTIVCTKQAFGADDDHHTVNCSAFDVCGVAVALDGSMTTIFGFSLAFFVVSNCRGLACAVSVVLQT